ncbi:DNA polymerase zeta [Basidiobolus ranarum]|uniref:DNA polymerase zeta catalytic subunit n=1 Tax=Basidiobolus ranarum TaxID=34480 RepID=A0ABR2WNL9_9FUNG
MNNPSGLEHHKTPNLDEKSTREVVFSCRIVNIDFEFVQPGPYDIHRTNIHPDIALQKVPVIRIFGSTENGQKTCLHVHQAFPYFYVEYKGSMTLTALKSFCIQLATSINHAVAVSLDKDPQLKNQYVLTILPVKGVPFYGYYKEHRCFLKIYLVNPNIVSRVAELLQMGAIMGTVFQPYEAHIPFLLQFFIDYNLYGMNYINLDDMVTRVNSYEKQPWEDSVVVKETVLNKDLISERDIHTVDPEVNGYQANVRLVHSLKALWQDEEERCKAHISPTETKPQAEDRGYSPWNNEAALREIIHRLVENNLETKKPEPEPLDPPKTDILDKLMTAYQAIDGLFKNTLFLGEDTVDSFQDITSSAEVYVDDDVVSQRFSSQNAHQEEDSNVDQDLPLPEEQTEDDMNDEKFWEQFELIDDEELFNVNVENQRDLPYQGDKRLPTPLMTLSNKMLAETSSNHKQSETPGIPANSSHFLNHETLNAMSISDEPMPMNFATCPILRKKSPDIEDSSSCQSFPIRKIPQFDGPGDLEPPNNPRFPSEKKGSRTPIFGSTSRKFCRIVNKSNSSNRRLLYQAKNREPNQKTPKVPLTSLTIPILPSSQESPTKRKNRDFQSTSQLWPKKPTDRESSRRHTDTYIRRRRRANFIYLSDEEDEIDPFMLVPLSRRSSRLVMDFVDVPHKSKSADDYLFIDCSSYNDISAPKNISEVGDNRFDTKPENNYVRPLGPYCNNIEDAVTESTFPTQLIRKVQISKNDRIEPVPIVPPCQLPDDVSMVMHPIDTLDRDYFTKNITTMWSPAVSPTQEVFEEQPIIEILSLPSSPVKDIRVPIQSHSQRSETSKSNADKYESSWSEIVVPATIPHPTQDVFTPEDIEVVIPASNISREQFVKFLDESEDAEKPRSNPACEISTMEMVPPIFKSALANFEIEIPAFRYPRESFLMCTTSTDLSDNEPDFSETSIEQLESEYESLSSSEDAAHSDFEDDEISRSSSPISDIIEVTPTKKTRHGVLFGNWKEAYRTPEHERSSLDESGKLLVASTPTRVRSQHDILDQDESPFIKRPIHKASSKIRSQPIKKKWTPQSFKERKPLSLSLKRISDFKPKDGADFTFLDILMKSKKNRDPVNLTVDSSESRPQKSSTLPKLAQENYNDILLESDLEHKDAPHISQSIVEIPKTDVSIDMNSNFHLSQTPPREKGKNAIVYDDPFRVEPQLITTLPRNADLTENGEPGYQEACVLRLGPTSSQLHAIENNSIYHTGDTPQNFRNREHSPSPFQTPTKQKVAELANAPASSSSIPDVASNYANTPSTPSRYSFKRNMKFLMDSSSHPFTSSAGRRSIVRSQEKLPSIVPHNPFMSSTFVTSNSGRHSITNQLNIFKIPTSPYRERKAAANSNPILNKFQWGRKVSFIYREQPPTLEFLEKTWKDFDLPTINYQPPFFSNEKDVPEKPRLYAGKLWKIKSKSISHLKEFETYMRATSALGNDTRVAPKETISSKTNINFWTSARVPPTPEQVEQWLQKNKKEDEVSQVTTPFLKRLKHPSQIEPTTPKNRYGFKLSQFTPASSSEHQIDILCIEILVDTRKGLLPDPNIDALKAICYAYKKFSITENDGLLRAGCIIVKSGESKVEKIAGHEITYVADERAVIDKLAGLVHQLNPDILGGFEIHKSSWGYLADRAKLAYGIELHHRISKMLSQNPGDTFVDQNKNNWNYKKASTFVVTGRHVLNIWRIMRGEVSLNIYSYENLVFHVLHQRVPHFKHSTIVKWINHPQKLFQLRAIQYYIDKAKMDIRLLEQTDVLNRTVEFAKVFGVDFFSVLSRGSQFKVESMMCRIAKPENYLLISPSRVKVAEMRAAESLPLVMEPESSFYTSPVVVLDFQSLYPSIMIAYNYCYSTCLGKIQPTIAKQKFGVTSYVPPIDVLSKFEDQLNVAPNGVAYLKPSVRKGLLGKMLTEILDTRVMVKTSMKKYKKDKALTSLLNARQLSLKFIANVTYGYTGASYSGRMPSVEIADSIVQTGRETLEKVR